MRTIRGPIAPANGCPGPKIFSKGVDNRISLWYTIGVERKGRKNKMENEMEMGFPTEEEMDAMYEEWLRFQEESQGAE